MSAINIRPLSKALQEVAESELNEIPSQVEENLKLFRNLLVKLDHLKYRDDDQHLITFLRGSKYSLQRAKEKLDGYYTFRTLAPEITRNMDPYSPANRNYLEKGVLLPLQASKEHPAGARVILYHHEEYDPDELTLTNIIRGSFMLNDIFLYEDDNYVISGVKVIWDMKGIHLKTALQTTPAFLKQIVYFLEHAFPTRIKAAYIINVPKFFEQIVNLGKRLVSKKLSRRVHVYSTNNLDAIYKDIPRSILPLEYGGNAGSLEDIRVKWQKTVESHRSRLLNEDNYYSDESKRLEESKVISNAFGMEGSFKMLKID